MEETWGPGATDRIRIALNLKGRVPDDIGCCPAHCATIDAFAETTATRTNCVMRNAWRLLTVRLHKACDLIDCLVFDAKETMLGSSPAGL